MTELRASVDDRLARQPRLRRRGPTRGRAGRPRPRSTGRATPPPSRTITWQVVHAHDFSHACSISIPWSSRLSQIDFAGLGLEGLALGRELSGAAGRRFQAWLGERVDRAAGERLRAHAAVHAPRGECLGRAVERVDGRRAARGVVARRAAHAIARAPHRSPRARPGTAGRRRPRARRRGRHRDVVGARRAPRRAHARACRRRRGRTSPRSMRAISASAEAVRRLDRDRRLDAGRSARAPTTDSRPSASTWNVTRMRAAPATIGGIPRSSKRASERQSATRSRSPCTTWIAIAVWPSLHVVNSCARVIGIVALRGTIFSARPPIVSTPERQRDHVEQQPVVVLRSRLPASAFGLHRRAERDDLVGIEVGERRLAEERRRPHGGPARMRVAPPTSTTPSMSPGRQPGVAQRASHRRDASSATRLRVISRNIFAVSVAASMRWPRRQRRDDRRRRRGSVSISFASRERQQQQPRVLGRQRAAASAASMIQQNTR